ADAIDLATRVAYRVQPRVQHRGIGERPADSACRRQGAYTESRRDLSSRSIRQRLWWVHVFPAARWGSVVVVDRGRRGPKPRQVRSAVRVPDPLRLTP